jgi:hypothetical protein
MTHGQKLMTAFAEVLLNRRGIRDYRPSWLFGMEIDLYFPELGFGLEFQGDQHYIPVYGKANLDSQQARDKRKKALARERGEVIACIDTADLSADRIKMKLKWARKEMRGGWKIANAEAAKHLDAAAKSYRATIKANYQSPSSFKKKSAARVIEELESGIPLTPWTHRKLSKTQTGQRYLKKIGKTSIQLTPKKSG